MKTLVAEILLDNSKAVQMVHAIAQGQVKITPGRGVYRLEFPLDAHETLPVGLPQNLHHLLVGVSAPSHRALRSGCRRGSVSRLSWSEKRRAGQDHDLTIANRSFHMV